jgi:hypothetical protein
MEHLRPSRRQWRLLRAIRTADSRRTLANAPTGAVRNNNVVTITTTTAHNLYPGATVLIAGVVDATFDGTFLVQSVPSTTTLTYQQLGAASNSGGSSGSATATLAPQLSAGVHQVSVLFQTRQGYLTQPSPPVTWTASGGHRVQLTGIDGHAVGIEIGALGDHALVVGDAVAGDLPRAAPDRAEGPRARAAVDVV